MLNEKGLMSAISDLMSTIETREEEIMTNRSKLEEKPQEQEKVKPMPFIGVQYALPCTPFTIGLVVGGNHLHYVCKSNANDHQFTT